MRSNKAKFLHACVCIHIRVRCCDGGRTIERLANKYSEGVYTYGQRLNESPPFLLFCMDEAGIPDYIESKFNAMYKEGNPGRGESPTWPFFSFPPISSSSAQGPFKDRVMLSRLTTRVCTVFFFLASISLEPFLSSRFDFRIRTTSSFLYIFSHAVSLLYSVTGFTLHRSSSMYEHFYV